MKFEYMKIEVTPELPYYVPKTIPARTVRVSLVADGKQVGCYQVHDNDDFKSFFRVLWDSIGHRIEEELNKDGRRGI